MILNKEQVEVVRKGIIDSMKNVYTDMGSLPGDGFYEAAGSVADKIIKNVQAELQDSEPKKKNARK